MNRRFLISWIVVFVAWMAGSFVVHAVLLGAGYAELTNLFRTDEDAANYSHVMLITFIIMTGAFVWIYQRGNENKPWVQQGLRFGIAIALLGPVSMYTMYYVFQPIPGAFVVQQALYEGVLVVILGLLVAFLNKPAIHG
jgi:hypothetical protein